MPDIALISTPSFADGWHNVRAPGGYEWWYFDAQDHTQDVQVVFIALDGFVFHPRYIRQFGKYARRPTQNMPPFPADYPCAYLCIYEKGRIAAQFMCEYPKGSLRASTTKLDVSVGPNHVRADADGEIEVAASGVPWRLTARGPQFDFDKRLKAQLRFDPRLGHTPNTRTFLSKDMTGSDHRWILANPLCDVGGTIELGEPGQPGYKRWDFSGLGYHDHNLGDAPIGPGLKHWIWGRAMFDDEVLAFHFATAKDDRIKPDVHVVSGHAGRGGLMDLPVSQVTGLWNAITGWGLSYPKALELPGVMSLSDARVIDSTPFYLRLAYQAALHNKDGEMKEGGKGGGKKGAALCEIAYPHRLRWPILGRMVEMSMLKCDESGNPVKGKKEPGKPT